MYYIFLYIQKHIRDYVTTSLRRNASSRSRLQFSVFDNFTTTMIKNITCMYVIDIDQAILVLYRFLIFFI
jgi:hypothetical protein